MDPKRLADDALDAIAKLPFPGNVRQLENLCHWLTVMAPAQVVGAQDLPPDAVVMGADLPEGVSTSELITNHKVINPSDWESAVALVAKQLLQNGTREVFSVLETKFERAILVAALEVTRGRRVEAAERLGIGRNTITRKLQELEIDI
jgi:two-component system nitrogen regulation response regulator GlnG